MKRQHWINHRDRHYNRVIMPRQAKDYKKRAAWLGLGFVGILVLGLIAIAVAH